MTLGRTPVQPDLSRSTGNFCEDRVDPDSIYGVLHRECFQLFPDQMFADLFTDVGRRSVPPMIVAVVMVLQRIEGLSDREAVDRFRVAVSRRPGDQRFGCGCRGQCGSMFSLCLASPAGGGHRRRR